MVNREQFERIKLLGEGSFAQTWLARVLDPELIMHFGVDEVALKIPLSIHNQIVLQTDIDILASLHRQLSKREIKNIIRYLGAWPHEGRVVMVMKYVSEGNLRTKMGSLMNRNILTPEQGLTIMKGILSGLSAIHKKHIIHRDLKPENILMDGNNPLIADFGVSRIIREGEIPSARGTLYYRAPEMFLKQEKATFNADIWSVGITCYEMLCAQWPFGINLRTDDVRLMNLIIDEEVKLMFPKDIVLPDKLKSILARMLEKNPQKRYKTAEAVLRDIKAMEDDTQMEQYRQQYGEIEPLLDNPDQAAQAEAGLLNLMETFPDLPETYMRCAEYYNQRGDTKRAIKVFTKGVARCKKSPNLLFQMALTLDGSGDLPAAIEALEQSFACADDEFKEKWQFYWERLHEKGNR